MRLAGHTALYAWQKWEVHVKCQKNWIKRSLEDLGENEGKNVNILDDVVGWI
jgi:hypothetical protein